VCTAASADRDQESTPLIPPLQHDIRPGARDSNLLRFPARAAARVAVRHMLSTADARICARGAPSVKQATQRHRPRGAGARRTAHVTAAPSRAQPTLGPHRAVAQARGALKLVAIIS
jgi:hypothetical protein